MHIVEFTAGSLRYRDDFPEHAPADGFVWAYMDRADFLHHQPALQEAAQRLGGSAMLDVHLQDLASDAHPSNYDATSVYDVVIFRRLATGAEMQTEAGREAALISEPAPQSPVPAPARPAATSPDALGQPLHIGTRAVGFAIFDRLLISVHPAGCYTATQFIQRAVADARLGVDTPAARSRLPLGPSDLVLRIVNVMVDSYLALRKDLTAWLERAQTALLRPGARLGTLNALMLARRELQTLEDLCEEQQDAMQEWLDTLRELPLSAFGADAAVALARRDQLIARARDIMEHIDRVLHHARRLEQSAETVVQIHFSVQGHRTNEIMRTLTAVTAIFLPLNLFTGFFGMNFEHLPLIHSPSGMWLSLGLLIALALGLWVWFLRKHLIADD